MTKRNIFKVVGMSTPRSFTCNSNTGEIFWAKSGLTEEKYNTIFSWAKEGVISKENSV